MRDDGLDPGAGGGADPLSYVNYRLGVEPTEDELRAFRDNATFWENWRRTQAARIERGTK